MKATVAVIQRAFLVLSAFLAPLLAQTPGSQPQQPEFIRQGQQLMHEGKLDDALALYRKTLQTSPNSVPALIAAGNVLDLKGQDLWEFRWEHAQARIAARRGNQTEAQKRVAAAKAILDKGTNPEQTQFLPYLQGYVAFYAGDYKAALEELLKANQNDPFIQCIIGQTYERLGDRDKALEYYRKASAAISHNTTAAYAVPFAKKMLASLPG